VWYECIKERRINNSKENNLKAARRTQRSRSRWAERNKAKKKDKKGSRKMN